MVMSIKYIKSNLPNGLGMNFYNFEDKKNINLDGESDVTTSSWVPYQNPGLLNGQYQIRIQIKNEHNNFHVDQEFYLWDDNYKLICSGSEGIKIILTVSGSRDIGITVSATGVQAYLK